MKRKGNLYAQIVSLQNLRLADALARRGKGRRKDIVTHDKNQEANLESLHHQLLDRTYKTSTYRTFLVREPKERLVYELPFYPDRIVHQAIINILEPIFLAMFTADTYSCIKGKGIHAALRAVKLALRDEQGTKYCLKMDIRKFYPSVDHKILKQQLRRKFKDDDLLWLLDEIIDSAPGLPIGNLLSQYFANFYLTGFDHWLKELRMVRRYFRYSDDLVIPASNKPYLHQLLADIKDYLQNNLKLDVKANYQIFPIAARGVDFVGYVFYHTHIRMRKTIKKRFARLVAKKPNMASIASYYGWACHANCNHLLKTLLREKFYGFQHRSNKKRLRRRQNKNRTSIKCVDHSPFL